MSFSLYPLFATRSCICACTRSLCFARCAHAQELRRILDDVANLARILTSPDALAAYAALPITEEAAADREAEARASLTAAAAGGADATAIPNKQRAYTGDSYKLKV